MGINYNTQMVVRSHWNAWEVNCKYIAMNSKYTSTTEIALGDK